MNRTLIATALAGVVAGAGLAWVSRPRAPHRDAPAAPVDLPPDDVGRDDHADGAAPDLATQVVARRATRTTYDTMRSGEDLTPPVDVVRDERWAVQMEAAVTQHSQAELRDLMPGAEWLGVECMSQTCRVRMRARTQPPVVIEVISTFVFGPGTARSHEATPVDDGESEYTFDVHYRDDVTRRRLTGDEYLGLQRLPSPAKQELRANVRDHFHNHPDDEH